MPMLEDHAFNLEVPVSDILLTGSTVTCIAAVSQSNLGIGYRGGLPWPTIREDSERLNNRIRFSTIILGSRTFECDCNMEGLGNLTIVVHHNAPFLTEDYKVRAKGNVVFVPSPDAALEAARAGGNPDIVVLGGGSIYKALIEHADYLDLTEIGGDYPADTFFPSYSSSFSEEWRECRGAYAFVIYKKKVMD